MLTTSQVIDNVTFSLPHQTILVHLIDGTSINVDLSDECVEVLHNVINEVQLSFAAANAPPPPPPPAASPAESPRSSMSQDRSAPPSPNPGAAGRRSPSSLLFSLLSPLLPTAPPKPSHVQAAQQPARAHRRQARSLLVDAYRRHVLPVLKQRLPAAYLVWAIESETASKLDEFAAIKDDIAHCLNTSNISLDSPTASIHSSVASSSSDASGSDCESEYSSDLPAPTAAQAYIMSLPSPQALPAPTRSTYASHVSRAAELSTRVGDIQRLACRYEREEGKRRWLDELDLQRDGDKAVRRAISNALLPSKGTAAPLRRSPLRQSTTASEIQRPHLDLEAITESLSDDCLTPDLSDDNSSLSESFSESEPSTPTPRRNSLDESFDWEREDAPSPSPEPEYMPKQDSIVFALRPALEAF